jgi:hypothetical protein
MAMVAFISAFSAWTNSRLGSPSPWYSTRIAPRGPWISATAGSLGRSFRSASVGFDARRRRAVPDEEQRDAGGEQLQDQRDPPRPVCTGGCVVSGFRMQGRRGHTIRNVPKLHARRDDAADVPTDVERGRQTQSLLLIRQLANELRAAYRHRRLALAQGMECPAYQRARRDCPFQGWIATPETSQLSTRPPA